MKLNNKLAIALSMSVLVCVASYAQENQSNLVHDYNLTEVEKIGDEYYLNGEKVYNVITKYIDNVPHYYLVTIKENVLGTDSGDNQKYFYFEKDAKGNYIIKNTDKAEKAEITGNYSSQDVLERVSNPNTETYQSGINGEFVNKTLEDNNARGAALFNNVNTFEGNINANFINNGINASGNIYGGAIYNGKYSTESGNSILGNITGDFINNYITGTPVKAYGGAIYTGLGSIGDITGDFIGNHIVTTSYDSATSIHGGAIATSNNAPVGSITGNFINNYLIAQNDGATALGGAIYVMSKVDKIEGDFIGNYAIGSGSEVYGIHGIAGGAVYTSSSEIAGGIKGDFIGNYINNNKNPSHGGAIFLNSSKIGTIEGDYTQNSAITNSNDSNAHAYGGALGAWGYGGKINAVKGSFTGNNAIAKNNGSAYGGAISNYGVTIEKIESDFRNNAASANKNSAYGGAISNMDYSSNSAYINSLTGEFVNNTAISNANSTSDSTGAFGGAVYNSSSNTFGANFKTKYTGNSAIAENAAAAGGALYNKGTYSANTDENNITTFENNTAKGKNAYGGAVYNSKNYTDQNVKYINNNVNSASLAQGGAIHSNAGMVILQNAEVLNNNVSGKTAQGGGLSYYNKAKSSSGNNGAKLTNVKFENNNVNGETAQGGAIYNNNGEIHIYSGEFKNNNVDGTTAQGGAIYTTKGNLFIDAKEGDILFEGNKANGVSNALHTSKDASVTLGAKDNYKVIFNDAITSDDDLAAGSRRTLSINRFSTAEKTGTVEFNNSVSGNNIYVGSGTKGTGTLHLGSYTDPDGNRVHGDFDNGTKLTLAGSNLDMVDGFTDAHTAGEIVIDTNTNISIDVDLANNSYDYFNVDKLTKSYSSRRLSLKDINFVEKPTGYVSTVLDVIRGVTGVGAVFENSAEMGEWGLVSIEDLQDGSVRYTVDDGRYNLKKAVDWNKGNRDYTLAQDEIVETNLNKIAGDGSKLNVDGKGFVVDGKGFSGIEVSSGQTLSLNNTEFKNFANTANAGAIDNAGTLSLNNTSIIQNTKDGQSHAIHNTGTISLNGNTLIDGAITGNGGYISVDGGNVEIRNTISGNSFDLFSGTLKFNPDTFAAENNTICFYGGHIDLNDGITQDYRFNSLDASMIMGELTYGIDIDFANKKADKIIITGSEDYYSSGSVLINNINVIAPINPEAIDENYKISLLQNNANSTLYVELAQNVQDELNKQEFVYKTDINDSVAEEIQAVNNWDKKYYNIQSVTEYIGKLGLNDSADSLIIKNTGTQNNEKKTTLGDTLALVNTLSTSEDRVFRFDSADNKYNVESDLGQTTAGKLSILGVSDGNGNKSAIDLNNHSGFELNNNSELNINDTKLTGNNEKLINVTNENAVINLNNAVIDGNITGDKNYNINITGEGETELNGSLTNASAKHSKGTLKFKENTFADNTNSLITTGGNISLNNKQTEEYIINSLDSSENTKYSIDVNLSDKSSDKITVKNGKGTVTIDKLDIKGEISDAKSEFQILILNDENKQMNLELSENAKKEIGDKYLISSVTENLADEIKEETKWNEEYNEYSQLSETFGKLDLVKIDSEKNNGIGIVIDEVIVHDKEFVRPLGDTLKIVNNDEKQPNKKFTFDAADNVYTVKDNLGETKHTLTIKGVSDKENSSAINLNNHSGFEVKKLSKLNISDVILTNAKSQEGSVIKVTEPNAEINLKNTSLINNKAESEHGGAIYSDSDVNIIADSGNSIISGNKTSTGNEAIFMGSDATLTLKSVNKGNISVSDKINGEEGYSVYINGDSTGEININNSIENAKIKISNALLTLANNNNFKTSDVTFNSGTLNLVNNAVEQQEIKSLTVNGNMKLNLDADLKNAAMDRLPENTVILNNAKINVDRINLLSDADERVTRIPFTNNTYKNNVEYIGKAELSKDTQLGSLYAPIYKYMVKYDNEDDLGYFQFTRGEGSSFNDYNPAVMAAPIASQLGGYLTQLNSYDEAFRNMDMYMLMTKTQRLALKYANKYAAAEEILPFNAGIKKDNLDAGGWFRPYTTFEKVGLKNGPKVNNTAYGTFAGFDSRIKEFENGWDGNMSVYAAYNGSHQSYSGNSIYQNGATLGLTGMLYKGNFFAGLTTNVGSNIGEANTMYGNEDFAMLMTGVALKTGYNAELGESRFIIQPNYTMSYSMVNTFNYTNAADVKINQRALHALQLEPGLKLIANLNNGWQPYAGVSVVWNLFDKTNFSANYTALPSLSVKPYAKYGLGVRKIWDNQCSGHIQGFLTSGGRNGIGLQAGFKWLVGRENLNL